MKITSILAIVLLTLCACSNGASAPATTDAASAAASSDTAPTTAIPATGLDARQLFSDKSFVSPTPNPQWYGQGPYRNPKLLAASLASYPPPVFQASWNTPNWWVDPVSGSDVNDCVTISTPCKTYAQIAARWGTWAPRLRQATVITFKTSQPDATDPIILRPFIENGGSIAIEGTLPAALQTGTLSGVVSMVRATGTLLTATIGAGGAAGQLVQNTTHSSYAWVYKNSSGNSWFFTRPFVPVATIPYQWFNAGTPVDTWANGDAYSVYAPVSIYLEDFEPIVASDNSSFGLSAYVYHCAIVGPANSFINNSVSFTVSTSLLSPLVEFSISAPIGSYQFFALNTYSGGIYFEAVQGGFFGSSAEIEGTVIGGYAIAPIGGSFALTKGAIIDATFSATVAIQGGLLNDVFIQSGTTEGFRA